MLYCGIDNGVSGAVVVLDSEANVVYRTVMPTLKSKNEKKVYDIKSIIIMFDIIKTLDKNILVGLEKAYVRPVQGIRAAFSTGYGYGIMQALLEANKISYEIINPTEWMKQVFIGSYNKEEKKQSVIWAQRKYPNENWRGTLHSHIPHNGLTDACGIAFYMYLRNRGGLQ